MPAPQDPASRSSSTDEQVPFGYLPEEPDEEPDEEPKRREPAPEPAAGEPERPRRRRRRRRSRTEDPDADPDPRALDSTEPLPSPREESPRARGERAPEALAGGRVVEWHGFRLLPFQIQAVDAVRNGHNVLVAAPTGAGKTLVAEYAVEDAVKRGKRVVYTSPIKALSSQKYRDFKEDPAVEVGIMTGDVTLHPRAQVLVMTTEILRNAIFENPELIEDVEFVVFDEVHFLDDRERGMVWEECFIFLPPHVRLICLSATIQNVDELGAWIGQVRPQDNVVILEDRRPVPLSHWVHTEAAATFPPARLNHHRKKAGEAVERERRSSRGSRRTRGGGRGRVGRDLLLHHHQRTAEPGGVKQHRRMGDSGTGNGTGHGARRGNRPCGLLVLLCLWQRRGGSVTGSAAPAAPLLRRARGRALPTAVARTGTMRSLRRLVATSK